MKQQIIFLLCMPSMHIFFCVNCSAISCGELFLWSIDTKYKHSVTLKLYSDQIRHIAVLLRKVESESAFGETQFDVTLWWPIT